MLTKMLKFRLHRHRQVFKPAIKISRLLFYTKLIYQHFHILKFCIRQGIDKLVHIHVNLIISRSKNITFGYRHVRSINSGSVGE
jgi:hypothetical protein